MEKKITVVFINIGRNKICETVEIENTKDYDLKIINHAKKYLVSQDVSIAEYENNKFNIYAGFQKVGQVEII